MSSLINKAKDALSSHKNKNTDSTYDDTSSTTAAGGYGTSTNDPAYNNPQSTNAGPHDSNLLNKVDPRVDSDRDHRNDPTSRVGGYGGQDQYSSGNTGSNLGGPHHPGHTGGAGGFTSTNDPNYNNPQSGNAGPHSSAIMNTVDPRVDSDRSRVGGQGVHDQYSSGQGLSGNTAVGGYQSSTTTTTTTGPHDSALMNKLDPRVDSDQSRVGGHAGYTGTGVGGYQPSTTTAGPHDSALMNKLDPKVDSDQSRIGGHGTHDQYSGGQGYGSTGTAAGGYQSSTTTGPHDSAIMNKLDPRVDSDPTRVGGGYGDNTTGGVGAYGNTGGIHEHHQGHHQGQHHPGQHHPGQHLQGQHHQGEHHQGQHHQGHHHDHHHGHHSGSQETAEYASTGTGKSTNAGPHNSNLLNKLDPRVDSDLSGGKTYGGDATRQ